MSSGESITSSRKKGAAGGRTPEVIGIKMLKAPAEGGTKKETRIS